jgi:hypothetical protein
MAGRTATCPCRKLRGTCAGEPKKISVCHCLECQRRTGHVRHSRIFARSEQFFWEPERRPDAIAIAVGRSPPSQSVYNELRHPWVSSLN